MSQKRLSLVLVLLLCAVGPVQAATVTNTSSPNLAIAPDNGCVDDTNAGVGLGGVTDTIAFTETGNISDVNVHVEITHTWRGDLQMILLYSGGGGTVRLANVHGNSGNSDNYFATFDSEAGVLCSDATMCGSIAVGGGPCQTAPGPTCQPDQSLTAFNALACPGTFTLRICDRVAVDTGTLNTWSVSVTGDHPVELQTFTID